MKRVAWLGALVVAACGADPATPPGGGESPPRAFDVTVTLTVTPPDPSVVIWAQYPKIHTFTLVLDDGASTVIVGSKGKVASAPLRTDDRRTFAAMDALTVPIVVPRSCADLGEVTFAALNVTRMGAQLTGTATGSVAYIAGDQVLRAPMTALLAGVPDVTAPAFIIASSKPIDPMQPFAVGSSEPLPPDASLALHETTGADVVTLDRVLAPGAPVAIAGFAKPTVMLRYASSYRMTTMAADFQGNPVGALPVITTVEAPPTVREDGFESIGNPTFGGAGVLNGPPLTAVTGTRSLILNTGVGGGFGFLPYRLGPSVAMRVAVSPGDSRVRMNLRTISVYDAPGVAFQGVARVGAIGKSVVTTALPDSGPLTKVTLPVDGDLYLGAVTPFEIALPAGAAAVGEVTFSIVGQPAGCGGQPPPPTALVVDDLIVD